MMMSSASGRGRSRQISSTECIPSSSVSEAIGKSSNSSNETVIARIESTTSDPNQKPERLKTMTAAAAEGETTSGPRKEDAAAATTTNNIAHTEPCNSGADSVGANSHSKRRRLKSFLLFTAHLNPFHNNGQHNGCGAQPTASQLDASTDLANNQADSEQLLGEASTRKSKGSGSKHRSYLGLIGLSHHLQRFLGHQRNGAAEFNQQKHAAATSVSAPVTPMKWRPLEGGRAEIHANGCSRPAAAMLLEQIQTLAPATTCDSRSDCSSKSPGNSANQVQSAAAPASGGGGSSPASRPSVRFVDNRGGDDEDDTQRKTSASASKADADAGAEEDVGSSLVAKLFRLPVFGAHDGDAQVARLEQCPGESPMNADKFRQYGYSLIDYISNYLETIDKRRVTPLNIEPGYLKSLIQPDAPAKGESFASIMHDFENHIMCGITHWQHPHFHAYFPAGNAYPSILADMLSDALGCVGFSWAASPAYTELEIIMLDWMGKMIGLPDEFLCLSGGRSGGQESKGGGVIQGSASECVLVNLLAARHWAMEKLRKRYPGAQDGMLLSKLIGYCSKEAHSCVEKAAMIGFIRMRALDTDEKHSLRGDVLAKAMQMDQANGLEPFIVCATLGTTSCVSFDNLEELGEVCQRHDVWLHVDAAYAGSALICPEFKYLMRGIERATSFNMNPNKWMLINFDCSLMWVKDRFKLTRAFVVDPLYLQHSFSDQAIDYRHWGIPLSRRFRALKLWFVIRNYGVEGLQAYIRNHVKLAKLFEQLIRQDARFSITNEVVLGLVCFRLVGSNALNQRLLSMINASGKLHMVPASLNGRYVIRFCVCDRDAKEADILYAYKCISDFATELFELIRAGKERIRAISQQNTIDVSSISLHKQQSASADCLNNLDGESQEADDGAQAAAAGKAGAQQVPTAAGACMMRRNSRVQQLASDGSIMQQQAASITPLSARNSPSAQQQQQLGSLSAKSPLMKQASVLQPVDSQQQQQTDEDLEQEIVLDSLATIDGFDYDLEDDDLLEPPLFGDELGDATAPQAATSGAGVAAAEQQADDANEWRSPVARHWSSRAGRASRNHTLGGPAGGEGAGGAGEHEDEAKDEVFTLAERRQRMSLRYKREFFVRVVSDPRVYRASISGDINAHSSSCSLGGSQHQNPAAATSNSNNAATTTSVPAQSGGDPSSSASDEVGNTSATSDTIRQ